MRTVEYKNLRPKEIIEAKKEKSIVYLPIAPLEWHGPAMPFGTDPIAAEYTALEVAKTFGGVVMPTVYIGTERERSPELLDALGFEDVNQYIVGQDFPKNTVKSFYTKEDVFAIIIREHLRLLVMQGYELIVIVNGHGATNQISSLERLAIEFSNETNSEVMYCMGFAKMDENDNDFGHATIKETAIQMWINPENVDLSELPPKQVKLKNSDWGIVDGTTFALEPNEDKTVIHDPRDSTKEQGKLFLEVGIASVVKQVSEKWESIDKNKSKY